jgi:hypothetical protein
MVDRGVLLEGSLVGEPSEANNWIYITNGVSLLQTI